MIWYNHPTLLRNYSRQQKQPPPPWFLLSLLLLPFLQPLTMAVSRASRFYPTLWKLRAWKHDWHEMVLDVDVLFVVYGIG